MSDNLDRDDAARAVILEYASDIVSAYVSNNPIQSEELPNLIRDVHSTLKELKASNGAQVTPEPAIPIKKSITDDFLICLEDGKKFKSLKRHLRSKYGMSPEEYREKWGLPYDYPMVAPSYARKRSALAKEMGLGKLEK
ncbi:MAG: Ros/MucR family transcriptional regulator [Henriciella sp.]|jgi:predicted transcriptional regulator